MARKLESKKKEELSDIVDLGAGYQAAAAQAESTTHLEDDTGFGSPAILRQFEFAANPEVFKAHPPTKQDLFNYHLKGIEVMLWRDGLKPMTDVTPKLIFNKKKTKYSIFVGAEPQKGQMVLERTRTLSQIAHNQIPT